MASVDSIHVGDIGTQLIVLLKAGTTDIDPTDSISKQFFIQRKSKQNVLQVTPEIWTDPDDNKVKLRYISKAGDFSIAGKYSIQAYVEFADGEWHSTASEFTVSDNIIHTELP